MGPEWSPSPWEGRTAEAGWLALCVGPPAQNPLNLSFCGGNFDRSARLREPGGASNESNRGSDDRRCFIPHSQRTHARTNERTMGSAANSQRKAPNEDNEGSSSSSSSVPPLDDDDDDDDRLLAPERGDDDDDDDDGEKPTHTVMAAAAAATATMSLSDLIENQQEDPSWGWCNNDDDDVDARGDEAQSGAPAAMDATATATLHSMSVSWRIQTEPAATKRKQRLLAWLETVLAQTLPTHSNVSQFLRLLTSVHTVRATFLEAHTANNNNATNATRRPLGVENKESVTDATTTGAASAMTINTNGSSSSRATGYGLIALAQWQVALRLALWGWGTDVFVQTYYHSDHCAAALQCGLKNKKRNSKRKQQNRATQTTSGSRTKKHPNHRGCGGGLVPPPNHHHPNESGSSDAAGTPLVLNDIVELLQLAALRILSPDIDMSWVHLIQGCVTREQAVALPLLSVVWEAFERPNPFREEEDLTAVAAAGNNKNTVAFLLSPTKRKPKVKVAVDPSSKETRNKGKSSFAKAQSCHAPNGNNSSAFPLVDMALTSVRPSKPNSLLLPGKTARYVASHFNTRLSNAHALFRQVTVPLVAPQKSSTTLKKRQTSGGSSKKRTTTAHREPTFVATKKRKLLRNVPPTATVVPLTQQDAHTDENQPPNNPNENRRLDSRQTSNDKKHQGSIANIDNNNNNPSEVGLFHSPKLPNHRQDHGKYQQQHCYKVCETPKLPNHRQDHGNYQQQHCYKVCETPGPLHRTPRAASSTTSFSHCIVLETPFHPNLSTLMNRDSTGADESEALSPWVSTQRTTAMSSVPSATRSGSGTLLPGTHSGNIVSEARFALRRRESALWKNHHL